MSQGFTVPGLRDNQVTDAKLRDSAALSVIGRSVNSSGDPGDITSSANGQVLTRDSDTIAWTAPFSGSILVHPLSLSPYVWLDPSQESYANNDAVGTAHDFSGNGRDFTQSTAGAKPTFKTNVVNSLPAFSFDGGDCLSRASVTLSTFAVLMVVRLTTSGIMYEHSAITDSNPGSFMFSTTSSSGGVNRGGVKSGRDFTALWARQNLWGVALHVYRGETATHNVWWNNVRWNGPVAAFGSGDPGTGSVTDTLFIGGRNAASSFVTGHIADVIIMTPCPAAADLQGLVNYEMNKYGT